MHDQHAVGVLGNIFHRVADQQNRDAGFFVVVLDLAQNRVAALGVQARGGFVQHQHAGVHGHNARNRNAALLPTRKLEGAFFQQLIR